MRLWKEGENGSIGSAVRATVRDQVEGISRTVLSRGVRAVNALRNAELEVLKGQRSGKVYRKPHTKHATYTASAPGEPPARRTGALRLHWNGQVKTDRPADGGVTVIAQLESQEPYAAALEKGFTHGKRVVKPRPFVEQIKAKAEPEIRKIYGEPYT